MSSSFASNGAHADPNFPRNSAASQPVRRLYNPRYHTTTAYMNTAASPPVVASVSTTALPETAVAIENPMLTNRTVTTPTPTPTLTVGEQERIRKSDEYINAAINHANDKKWWVLTTKPEPKPTTPAATALYATNIGQRLVNSKEAADEVDREEAAKLAAAAHTGLFGGRRRTRRSKPTRKSRKRSKGSKQSRKGRKTRSR